MFLVGDWATPLKSMEHYSLGTIISIDLKPPMMGKKQVDEQNMENHQINILKTQLNQSWNHQPTMYLYIYIFCPAFHNFPSCKPPFLIRGFPAFDFQSIPIIYSYINIYPIELQCLLVKYVKPRLLTVKSPYSLIWFDDSPIKTY